MKKKRWEMRIDLQTIIIAIMAIIIMAILIIIFITNE